MIDATPLLRLRARRRRTKLAREDPVATQLSQLLRLVNAARDTPFGRSHGFAAVGDVAGFQARVPLRRYEDFWRDWWQPRFPDLAGATWPGAIPYLALSSGTTSGTSKYIPVSPAMLRANTRTALELVMHHLAARPRSRLFGGKLFLLGGSTDLVERAPGILSGDISGIAARAAPRWTRPFAFPPPSIARINDWDAKVDACVQRAAALDIRCISGTPSWLAPLFERQAAFMGRPLLARDLYPRLELIVHGGVSFAPYRARFEAFLAGSHAELREAYAASEGFIAVADERVEDGLRLVLDNGLFFEFVPVEELDIPAPRRHWLADLETGVNYALVLSSCAGLWGYIVGDTVRFLSRRPPRLLVTGRTSYAMSAFGEHLIGAEIEDAVAHAARVIGVDVVEHAMGALVPASAGESGRHLFLIEFVSTPAAAAIDAFAAALDARLAALNDDYRAHRGPGIGMAAPRIRPVPSGFFAGWMKSRGRLGGQNKVPRVINDAELFADLRDFAARQVAPLP